MEISGTSSIFLGLLASFGRGGGDGYIYIDLSYYLLILILSF
jgi:hypothetical protein